LETFVQVVKLESFSKAAQKLYLTQPTVTSHIQSLEEELDTVLLNRFGKKVTTTGAGELLYDYAIEMIHMKNMAQFDLSAYNGKIQGHLSISASSIPRHYMLPELLKEFIAIYPDISFSVTERDSKKVVENILGGDTDFGLIGAKFPNQYLDYIEILEDRLCIIAPNNENFPWKNDSFIDKDFLLSQKFLLREKGSGTRHLIESTFLNKELDKDALNLISYVEDGEAIKKFVEEGIGVSFMSEKAVKREVELGVLKRFYLENLDFKRNFYFVYHNRRELSPLSKKFRDFILNKKGISCVSEVNSKKEEAI
jgi:LysR family transcriptional regulator, transcriptional activator of the cysJI operon